MDKTDAANREKMMRRTTLSLLLLFLCFSFFSSASGQTVPPIIVWSAGDLYTTQADGSTTPTAILTGRAISDPALSPNGSLLAFRAAAPISLEALGRLEENSGVAEFDLPADIYTYDLTTGALALVAQQPDDASLLVQGVADNAVVRSAPAWSPDGLTLAWTEFRFGESAVQLILYDLSRRLMAMAPIAFAPVEGRAPSIAWGEGGLALGADVSTNALYTFAIYTPDGLLRSSPSINATAEEALALTAWVNDEETGASLFGMLFTSGRWAMIDPATGLEVATGRTPTLIAALNPTQSLALQIGIDPAVGFFWETHDPLPSATAGGAFPSAPDQVTLAPDGRAVLFLGYPSSASVALWRDGEVVALPGTGDGGIAAGAVFWGATRWVLGAG